MQPYFMPYVGYFQLISAVDLFVVYDNIKYTKKGWINRNRMLLNGTASVFSLPLAGAPDSLDIRDREIAPVFRVETLLARVHGAYRRAPYFEPTYALLEQILATDERNLFRFLESSIRRTSDHLGIQTEIRRSSSVPIDHELRGQERVIAMCEAVGTDTYVNAIGGVELLSAEAFRARGMELRFLKSEPHEYPQLGDGFVAQLTILDVLMFNPISRVQDMVRTGYALIEGGR
jgi:hypothetical protein